MKMSRFRIITFLVLSLLLLVAVLVFGNSYAPTLLGDAGLRLQHFLVRPLFSLGGSPITFFFLLKAAIFLVALTLASHFTMLLLQKRVLTLIPLAIGQQYAVARVISYLVFVLGLIVGLQSLGLNLSSLVVVGGALGIGVGLGLQAIVSNFVAGLILLLEQPIKLGDLGAAPGYEPTTTSSLSFLTPNSSISALPIGLRMTGRSGYRFPLEFPTIAIQKVFEKFCSQLPRAILMFLPTPVPKSSLSGLGTVR
jgi:hypothetical protein